MRPPGAATGSGGGSACASTSSAGWFGYLARQLAASASPISDAPCAVGGDGAELEPAAHDRVLAGRGFELHAALARLAQRGEQL